MTERRTLRVRIAVAIAPDGRWAAHASSKNDDKTKLECAMECVPGDGDGSDFTTAFVEAEIELREPVTVEGTVAP